ncbi:hypothetical protein F5B21DRAFT_499716 [Xylaria acuta]|nr:hypothetical protein F5B21DRAFT_499716 [Xylaria acuta]
MAQYLPVQRTSFASLEDDRFFSAFSSQPASRLMSVFTSQEEDHPAEDANSATRPSEPLASVCLPLAESMLSSPREESPVPEPLADPHDHVPKHHSFNTTSTHHQSNQSGTQEPTAETATAYQGRLPLITRAQLDGYVRKQEINNILRSVRGYLSVRQHRESCGNPAMPIATEKNIPLSPFQTPSESSYLETQRPNLREDRYLVTTDDIVRILDLVVTDVRKFQDDGIQSDSSTHVKPTLHTQNIIPGASVVADPATTICLPQPCFSWADNPEVSRHPSPTAVTTYVSRHSITEID